jgi:acyl-CoA thioester hydrolase
MSKKTVRSCFAMKNHPPQLTHTTSYRVIYGDTDQMGVVYYANYLGWFERGRSEFLRQIGLPYAAVEKAGLHFPVVEVVCHYTQSARYDDVIQIETQLSAIGRASLIFTYRILRDSDKTLLATGSTKHACIDHGSQVTRIPKAIQAALIAAAR